MPQAQTLLQFQLQLNHQGEFHQVMEQCLAVAQLDRPNWRIGRDYLVRLDNADRYSA